MRGLFERCPVILASATPAIETRHQVALGTYAEVKLPGRYGVAEMPTIAAIDLIEETVAAGAAPQAARKWWLSEISRRANEAGVDLASAGVSPTQVAERVVRCQV